MQQMNKLVRSVTDNIYLYTYTYSYIYKYYEITKRNESNLNDFVHKREIKHCLWDRQQKKHSRSLYFRLGSPFVRFYFYIVIISFIYLCFSRAQFHARTDGQNIRHDYCKTVVRSKHDVNCLFRY